MKNKLLDDEKLLNTIVETKSNVYNKKYDKDCYLIGISVSPHTDIINIIKWLSETSEIKKNLNRNS